MCTSSVGVGQRKSLLSGDDHHGVAESIHRCSSAGGHRPAVPATGSRRIGRQNAEMSLPQALRKWVGSDE